MIVEYNSKYDDDIKSLLIELQKHIVAIDKEGYNILTKEYGDIYLKKTLEEVNNYEGKIFLYKDSDVIQGLIVGLINNEEEENYDFCAPKRGRITELVVNANVRSNGIGAKLIDAMEKYLRSVGCKDILIGVFGYNDLAIDFYKRNGYHVRMIEMTKKIDI